MLNAFPDHIFHMISIFILLARLRSTKTVLGLSVKTQELYLIVFLTRYIDIFSSSSIFNSIMKFICIASTALIIYLVYNVDPYKTSYLAYYNDTFLHYRFIIAPSILMVMVTDFFISPLNIIEVTNYKYSNI